jgi:flagellar hook-associated protein 3 FlgL
MRITNNIAHEMQLKNMNEALDKLYQYSIKAGTGKRYQVPSDAPTIAVEAMSIKSTLKSMEYYTSTAQSSKEWMSATEFALQKISDNGSRAEALVNRGLSDTMGPDERVVIAAELDGILEQAVSMANSKHRDRYLFSGFSTTTQPFVRTPALPPAAETVDYLPPAGPFQAILRDTAPGETITVNLDGPSTFDPLFQALIAARDALNANNMTDLRAAYVDLQNASKNVNNNMTTIGARLRTVETTIEKNQNSTLELQALLSQKEDANMAEAISQLKNQEIVYQAVLQVGAKANNLMSLFNVL